MKSDIHVPLNVTHSELAWLIRLRWLAVSLQFILGVFAFRYFLLYPEFRIPFYGTLATLVLFNLFSTSLLRTKLNISTKDIFLQLSVDVVAFTGLLIFTGGSRNPFVLLFLAHAILGAILLRARFRWGFLGLILSGVLATFGLRNLQVISAELYLFDAVPILSLIVCLLGIWGLSTWLIKALDNFRKERSERVQTQNRLDHLRALGALTAELSHQFATPLNTVKLKAERIARHIANENTEDDFLVLQEAIQQCEQVLRQIGHLPQSDLELKELAIGDFLNSLAGKWEMTSNTRIKKQISVNGSQCRLPPVAFAHALFNLLDNAARTGVETIEIQAVQVAKAVQITVIDQGPGFPDSVIKNLGKPFVSSHPEGTGLGLYNCFTLCEAIGGTLTIRNRQSGGAEVTLLIPVAEGAAV
jgi:two-component system sensor histidine kinase RegB